MIQTHLKKRVEIILEAPALKRLITRLDRAGVRGYTVVPAMAGLGEDGPWTREGLPGAAGGMVMVISIIDPSLLEAVLDQVRDMLQRQIGIVAVSDVQVIRAEHF